MDEEERWRRAADSDDRYLVFRRYRSAVAMVAVAAVAAMTLAIFLAVAALGLGEGWLAGLVTMVAMSLLGGCVAHLSNRLARARFIAEYRRLNKIGSVPGPEQAKRA